MAARHVRTFRKGDRIVTKTIDLRSVASGPLIPAGTAGTVKVVRRTGELWVELEGFGHRHVNAEHVNRVLHRRDRIRLLFRIEVPEGGKLTTGEEGQIVGEDAYYWYADFYVGRDQTLTTIQIEKAFADFAVIQK